MNRFDEYASRERFVLQKFIRLPWLEKHIIPNLCRISNTSDRDAIIALNSGEEYPLEIQYRNSDQYFYGDLISVINDRTLRGCTVPPESALNKLLAVAARVEKWGKFLNPEFQSRILVSDSKTSLLIINLPLLSKKLPALLSRYGFSFNRKTDNSRTDNWESAYIRIPVEDSIFKSCLINNIEDLTDGNRTGSSILSINDFLPAMKAKTEK